MVTVTAPDDVIRELDRRSSDGVEVTLLWRAATDRIFLSMVDLNEGLSFQFDVAAAKAMDAFRHPFAYAGHIARQNALDG